jgi:hypothetical protein
MNLGIPNNTPRENIKEACRLTASNSRYMLRPEDRPWPLQGFVCFV